MSWNAFIRKVWKRPQITAAVQQRLIKRRKWALNHLRMIDQELKKPIEKE